MKIPLLITATALLGLVPHCLANNLVANPGFEKLKSDWKTFEPEGEMIEWGIDDSDPHSGGASAISGARGRRADSELPGRRHAAVISLTVSVPQCQCQLTASESGCHWPAGPGHRDGPSRPGRASRTPSRTPSRSPT